MPLSSGDVTISTFVRAPYEWSKFGKKEALAVPGAIGVGGSVSDTESCTAVELV